MLINQRRMSSIAWINRPALVFCRVLITDAGARLEGKGTDLLEANSEGALRILSCDAVIFRNRYIDFLQSREKG